MGGLDRKHCVVEHACIWLYIIYINISICRTFIFRDDFMDST